MTTAIANRSVNIPSRITASLTNPSAYATNEIHDAYSWLRENQPLGLAEADDFDPFWVVTKHADILAVSRDNALFPSGKRATTFAERSHIARAHEITGSPHMVRSLVTMDGLNHKKYRGLTQAWFMPASIRKREDSIGRLAKATVDKMRNLGGRCDFVKDVALAYPLQVVMDILGVPPKDYPMMLRMTQEIFGPQDPDVRVATSAMTAQEYSTAIQAVVGTMSAYFSGLSADRKANPRDDLATLIAIAEIDGQPIGVAEATGYYIIVATAGHDTTSASTAAAMWALATQHGLLDRVKADMNLVSQLVEEAVRWATPVKTFMRSASEHTALRGQAIEKGDWLMLCYASGNRDEEVFDDPFSFNIDRTPNAQLAFGFGAHSCLGQHLARMEMKALFNELLPQLESVSLTGKPAYIESWFVNGLKSLPIEYRMSESRA